MHSVIDNSPLELARYATEIQRLEESLPKLRADRDLLESYSGGCRSVFSPVRRLPTELLVAIFDQCPSPDGVRIPPTAAGAREVASLAKAYLLQLSQVHSRWYEIIMNTPLFWATIVVDTYRWPKSSRASAPLLDLVASALKRSAGAPLTLEIVLEPHHPVEAVLLELLCHHSRRWKDVYMWLDPRAFGFLIDVRGNLPLLESLVLSSAVTDVAPTDAHADPSDIFEVAPRLRKVWFPGWPGRLPALPWAQLVTFMFENRESGNLPLDVLALLSPDAYCTLLLDTSTVVVPVPEMQPVTSNLSELKIMFVGDYSALGARGILGAILRCLTLPRLTDLQFHCQNNPPLWSQAQFLHFAARSSLRDTLTLLELDAVMEDAQLAQCLAVLPMLNELRIWDCEDAPAVLSDELLNRLTWDPTHALPNLVPVLRVLTVNSVLGFRDDAFLECVTSRARLGSTTGCSFTANVLYLLRCRREFSTEFIAELVRLGEEGNFAFVVE
ncbi:hypothetical protein DFH06DRAFT_1476106 [Mycena polygramma]|nr:hypothetical protein DFH06DRAFT_1476106 [Mycena polygramma]